MIAALTLDSPVAAQMVAEVDFAERAKPLLEALEAAAWHSDDLHGVRFGGGVVDCHRMLAISSLSEAHKHLTAALEDLRGVVASERGLWDGIDPDDIVLISVAQLAREHRNAPARRSIFAEPKGRN